MAETLTRVLELKVNGTNTEIKSIEQLKGAIKTLEQQAAKADFGSREFVKLNQELEKAKDALGDVKKSQAAIGNGSSAIGKFDASIGKTVKSFGALRTAIALTGLGALLTLITSVVAFFSRFAVVTDLVENATKALSTTLAVLFDRFGKLLSGDIVGAFSGIGSEIANNIRLTQELTNATRDLEDQQKLLEISALRTQNEVAKLLIQARDRTRTDEERIALLEEAGEKERTQSEATLKNARELLEVRRKELELNKAAFQAFLDQEGRTNTAQRREKELEESLAALEKAKVDFFYSAKLPADELALQLAGDRVRAAREEVSLSKESAAANDALIDGFLEQQKVVLGLEGQSTALQENIDRRINATKQEQKAEAEKARQDAIKARNDTVDAELKADQFLLDLQAAQLAGRKDYEAELERLRIARDKAVNELAARELKGEKVLREEQLLVYQNYNNGLAALDAQREAQLQADADKALDESQKQAAERARAQFETAKGLRELEAAEVKAIADDTSRTFSERIAAEQRLAQLKKETLTAEFLLLQKNTNLSAEQLALEKAKYKAAIAGINDSAATAQERLAEIGDGGFIARLFGIGTEEELAVFKAALEQTFSLAQDLATSALDSILAGAAARLEAQAATFGALAETQEQAAADALVERQTLQQNLFTADASQRAKIINLIQAQKKAEADAAKAAENLRQKERAAKTDAARKQRTADIAQAIVNGAQAILQNFASTPFPLNLINAGLIGALTAVQIGNITSQPLPTFAGGGFTGPGKQPDGTGQRVAGIVHANEYVAPSFVTRSPRAARPIAELERMRVRGFAEGGPTSPGAVPTTTTDAFDTERLIAGFADAVSKINVVTDVREVTDVQNRVRIAEAQARL